ncbi:MAG: class I SAM-dependent methyltransferase [Akkermansiaceae bacterium]|nr:class I SAM-dependent methyltransferase [Armatimonadota bacterium]
MPPSINYFAHKTAAERYAQSRPFFHPLVIDKIRETVPLAFPVANALDVGCGTGQSTVALRGIADSVIGIDASPDMLSMALVGDNIRYVAAPAENIPSPDGVFDLVTVSLAFHWFDRPAFFGETRRVLRENGWLAIYNNAFRGEMVENPAFGRWLRDSFLTRFPTPARNNVPVTTEEADGFGFRLGWNEDYGNQIVFSRDELAAYLLTQSNVIAAVEQGEEKIEEVYDWLLHELEPLFRSPVETFLFGGYIWYLQKTPA